MKIKFSIFIITILSSVALLNAQERTKDTIDDQVVNVIKPYTPTISDAFKIKDTPKLNDSNAVKKKEITYNIFSIPVASTFTPAKGKAATVDKAKQVKLFDNYASLGFGSYTTILGEVYLNHELSSTENVGGYFSHHSSAGGIDGLLLDDDFIKTSLNAHYSQQLRDFSWKVDGGYDLQTYNWYGLPQNFFGQAEADLIDPGHSFNSFNIGGKLNFDDAIIKDGSIRFRRFGDNLGSGENRLKLSGTAAIPIKDEIVETVVSIDYLVGSFENDYFNTTKINYGNFQLGLAPTYQLKQDDLTVNLGVTLTYLNDTEASKSSFFIYPNISASYRLVNEIVIAFGGVKGGLIQNSYYDFATENPFVSPTLFIAPTDQQYNAYAGLKGKLSNTIGYSVSGSYTSEKSKALFVNNPITATTQDYTYGNSFGIIYDDVTTLGIAGELSVDINRNFTMGIKGEYFVYNTKNEAEAWNLPNIKGTVFMDYQINEHWFTGGNLFFIGERKDVFLDLTTIIPATTTVNLDGYVDVNAHVGYHVNDRISVFLKGNNLVGGSYNKWQNTPVQGIQFLGGATYKFDF